MTLRKVQIMYSKRQLLDSAKNRLRDEVRFDITGQVTAIMTLVGWLDSEYFDYVLSWDEIATLSDDFPYLGQLNGDGSKPFNPLPHPDKIAEYKEKYAKFRRIPTDQRYLREKPKR